MAGGTAFLLGAALIAAPGGQATLPPDRFCVELRQMVDAAMEIPSFHSLEMAAAPLRLGFDVACRIVTRATYRRYVCAQALPPPAQRGERLAQDTVRCLPRTIRMTEPAGTGIVRLRIGTIAILISESAGPAGGVPDTVTYAIFKVPVHR